MYEIVNESIDAEMQPVITDSTCTKRRCKDEFHREASLSLLFLVLVLTLNLFNI